jgi:hypothetical protein
MNVVDWLVVSRMVLMLLSSLVRYHGVSSIDMGDACCKKFGLYSLNPRHSSEMLQLY